MKRFMFVALAIAIPLAAALAAGLLLIDGWRIDAPRISHLPGTAARALSSRECDELCRESMIPLAGASPRTPERDLHAMLAKQFGEYSGKELFDAWRDGRMIVAKEKLFFPTAELCRQEQLRGECAALCGEVMRSR